MGLSVIRDHLGFEVCEMAVEILKFEFCHLFFAVNPVPVVVACAVCRNSGIIVPKKAVARLRVVVLKPVVHTTGVVGTFHGKEPYSGPIPKGVFGVNQNVTICHPYYRVLPNDVKHIGL